MAIITNNAALSICKHDFHFDSNYYLNFDSILNIDIHITNYVYIIYKYIYMFMLLKSNNTLIIYYTYIYNNNNRNLSLS